MNLYLKKASSEYLESHTDGEGTAFSTVAQVTERRMTHHSIHCRILFLSTTWKDKRRIKNQKDITVETNVKKKKKNILAIIKKLMHTHQAHGDAAHAGDAGSNTTVIMS